MPIKIGTLQVDLRLLSAKFVSGMDQAGAATKRFGDVARRATRTLRAFSASAGVLAGIGGGSALLLGNRFAQLGDEIAKTADRLGLSTDALQIWRFAATQSSVSVETLETGLQRLSRRAGEFALTGGGTGAIAFQELGIAVTDTSGRMRSLEAILPDVAAALSQVQDENRATFLTQRLVDSGGVRLLSTFREVGDNFEEVAQRAERLGVIMDERLLRNAEVVSTQMDTLSTVIRARLGTAILSNTDLWISWGETVARVIEQVSQAFSQLQQNRFNQLIRQREELEEQIERLSQTRLLPGFIREPRLDDLRQQLADINAEIERRSEARIQSQRRVFEIEQRIQRLREQGARPQQLGQRFDQTRAAAAQAAQETRRLAQAAERIKDAVNPTREYNRELEELDTLVRQGLITTDEFVVRQRQLSQEIQEQFRSAGEAAEDSGSKMASAMEAAASRIESSITNAIISAELSLNSLQDVATSILQAIARQLLATFVVSPITSGITAGLQAAFAGGAGGTGGAATPRQHGGPVAPGRAFLVGERGPELFVPSSSGAIVPGGTQVVIEDRRGSDAPEVEVERFPGPGGVEVIRAIIQSEVRQGLNNGAFDRALRTATGARRQGVLR